MRKWVPQPNDVTNIAAFRWFANQIENEALELYATDQAHFARLEDVLRNTLKEIGYIRENAFIPQDENGCPDGWILCDGICRPSCDGIESESSGRPKR
jgi:hypothetical protein